MVQLVRKIQPYVVSVALLLLAFYAGKSCNEESSTVVTTETFTDTTFVTVTDTNIVNVEDLVYVYDTLHIEIPSVVDTTEVIKDYFTKKQVTSTAGNDTIQITITDTIYKNSISYRSVNWNLNVPIIQDSTYTEITKYRNGLYVGGQLGFLGENPSLTPTIHFIGKGRSSYSIGYDLFQRSLVLGYYYRLF